MLRRRNLSRTLKKAIHDPGYALTVFRKRLMSYFTYVVGNGHSAYPETVSLFLTYKCNLRCKMCGQWGAGGWALDMPREELNKELTFEQMSILIDELAVFKPALTLFGGEPFLCDNWGNLVCYIKSKGLRVNIITNGTLLSQHVEKVVDFGVDELIFSLDGPEDVHDEMRSSKGTFKRATNAFKELYAYKKKTGQKKPKVNINTTIFETNYRTLKEIIDIAASIGADTITYHHLIFQSMDICNLHNTVFKDEFGLTCRDWIGFARDTLPNIDTDYLIQTIHELRKHQFPVTVSVYPNFTDEEIHLYYKTFDFTPDSYAHRCISPWMTVYIFPNGEVRPCLDVCFVAGNILNEHFTDIWNNPRFKRYRSVLKKRGYFPACTRCTEFYRS